MLRHKLTYFVKKRVNGEIRWYNPQRPWFSIPDWQHALLVEMKKRKMWGRRRVVLSCGKRP